MKSSKKEQAKIISKAFYQKASSPIVDIPEELLHKNVEQVNASYNDKPPFSVVDLPSKTMSMTIGSLEPNSKSTKHRHSYETIMFIVEGEGYTMIEDIKVVWKKGDAVFFPVWAWHYNVNTSETQTAKYVSCDNAPMLHNLGMAMFESGS